jgi:sugar phosphate isomerase/epimerase
MVAEGPDGTGIEHIEKLAQLGYDYVELPTAQIMGLDEEAFAAFKERLFKAGIPCETSNNLFPVNLRLTGPDVDMDAIEAYARKAFARDEELGIKICVFGSGPAKNVPEGFPMEKGFQQVVEICRRIAPIAAEHGIMIVIEPLRKAECNMINSFAEGVELAKAVDVENVKVLVDFYHLTVESEPVSNLVRDGEKWLRHVHIANPTGRVYPASLDEADYEPFMKALKAAKYDARISCEAYAPNGFDKDAEAAAAFFRQLADLA